MDRLYSFTLWPTRQHYTTLHGSTASYGKTCTFENHTNLLAYLQTANWSLYTMKNDFQGDIKCQGGPFPRFAGAFSELIVQKQNKNKCQNTAMCTVHCATGTLTINLHSIKSSLLSLYLLCWSHDKFFQALSHFSVLQATERCQGLETRLVICHLPHFMHQTHCIFTAGTIDIAHNTTITCVCRGRASYPAWYMNESLVVPGPQYRVEYDPSTGDLLGILTIDGNEMCGIVDVSCRVEGQTIYTEILNISGL